MQVKSYGNLYFSICYLLKPQYLSGLYRCLLRGTLIALQLVEYKYPEPILNIVTKPVGRTTELFIQGGQIRNEGYKTPLYNSLQ